MRTLRSKVERYHRVSFQHNELKNVDITIIVPSFMTGWLNARTKKQGPLAFLSFLRIAKRLGSEG
jgi:uracil-DNA glycosylase